MSTEANPTAPGAIHGCDSEFVGVLRADGNYRLVAVRPITAGALLFRIEGERTREPTRYSVQIDEHTHIDLDSDHSSEEILDRFFWRFMNHSCDPNACIRGRGVFACRDIDPWADVTFNYNTTEFDMAEPFSCHCGSAGCHGTIKGFKHLTTDERECLRPMLAPYLGRLLGPCVELETR